MTKINLLQCFNQNANMVKELLKFSLIEYFYDIPNHFHAAMRSRT